MLVRVRGNRPREDGIQIAEHVGARPSLQDGGRTVFLLVLAESFVEIDRQNLRQALYDDRRFRSDGSIEGSVLGRFRHYDGSGKDRS